MSRLRIGTCSWKYPSWQGLVYSAPKGINYLKEYARTFDTVEIDQWFWSLFGNDHVKLPIGKDVVEYRQAVNKDFRFTIKAPNSTTLTHYYKKRKIDPLEANPHFLSPLLWRQFVTAIDPLKECLGPLILQFEYLNKQKITNQASFLSSLKNFFKEIAVAPQVAVETRNPYFINAEFFDFLERFRAVPVLLHGYWMPPVFDVYQKWKRKIIRHPTIIVRLHGGGRSDIEKLTGKQWNRIVTPKDEELVKIVRMVKEMLDNGLDVYFNVNNHYEGSAPLTIERITRLLHTMDFQRA